MKKTIIALKQINKSFATQVLFDVSFDIRAGEVTALLGENGAGKSTLMKIISGIYKADSGEIFLEGQKVEIKTPKEAQKLGISIIHQELNIVPNRTVAQNIFLGQEPRVKGFLGYLGRVNAKQVEQAATRELEKINAAYIDVHELTKNLTTAQRQLVEIAKALSFQARVLLMDEPTSSLAEDQSEMLIELIKQLKEQGMAIVFTTHRIMEAFGIADRFVILRDGYLVTDTQASPEVTYEKVIEWMVGRTVNQLYPKNTVPIGEKILEVEDLAGGMVEKSSFFVRQGEILGFAGLVGAGRTELMRLLLGIDKPTSKRVIFQGKPVTITTIRDAIALGIGFVPEDRKNQSLIAGLSVRENMALAGLPILSRHRTIIHNPNIDRTVAHYIAQLNIRLHSATQKMRSLSGGNQQKVVLAKWLLLSPRLLILDEPTRGIDVGAKAEIYQLLGKLVEQGIGIIMVSSDLPELLGVSDRIVVMANGKIMKTFPRKEVDAHKIMYYAGLHK
jgi:ABC-type sugar transport system ATPase subunit